MENEVQQVISSVKPLPQNQTLTPTPPLTNWSKILLFALLGLIVITGSVFAGIQIGKNQTSIQQPAVVQQTISPTQTVPSQTTPTTFPTANINPSQELIQNNKSLLSDAVTNYSKAIINNDRNTAMSFLTASAKEQIVNKNLDWPGTVYTYFETFEILNEFHSEQEESNFYNTEPVQFDVKFYLKDDLIGKLTKILFVNENGYWKTLTWNVFTSN